MPEHKNTEPIKAKIVDAYRRGVCDKDGVTLPKSMWGRNGKGSAYHNDYYTDGYRDNYVRLFGEKPFNVWPRDEFGNLIED